MPEFIDRIPSQAELEKLASERMSIQDSHSVENFKFGGVDYMRGEFTDAISMVADNKSLDDETKSQAIEILAKGTLGGHKLGHSDVNRNISDEWFERQYVANILLSSPDGKEVAQAIAEKGICGFHSTRSQALAGILETGFLMSARTLNEKGHTMVTGEHYYQKDSQGQESVSFSNLAYSRDAALNHAGKQAVTIRDQETVVRDMQRVIAELESLATESTSKADLLTAAANRHKAAVDRILSDPDSLFAALSKQEFPVMLGLSKYYLDETETRRTSGRAMVPGGSHLGEIRPIDEQIPADALPVIAVPAEVMGHVQELFSVYGYKDTKIVAIEPLVA